MGKHEKNRPNDLTLAKLYIVKAILDLLNVIVTIISHTTDN